MAYFDLLSNLGIDSISAKDITAIIKKSPILLGKAFKALVKIILNSEIKII